MWTYLRNKLGIESQEDRINDTIREINRLRDHITHIQSQKPKVIKQIIYKNPKNESITQEIENLKDREIKTHKIISDYRETFLEFIDIVSGKLENFTDRLDTFGDKLEKPLIHDINKEIIFSRPTNIATKKTTNRPIITTKRSTSITSTTDQIEQGELLWQNATDAEREIIKTLYDAGYPSSYNELAEKLKKSISTVKNHLNNLKSKGFKFQERTGINNTKKYLLDTRVKTFLTLRLND